jgi:hypothetical protein
MVIFNWTHYLSTTVMMVVLAICGVANASVQFFVNSPTTNSIDWTTSVTSLGAVVNTNVNFNTHPVGALISSFYTVSDGVTLTASSSDNNQVQSGAGPGQGNNTSMPLSTGEGPHAPSNHLFDGGSPSTLTISFSQAVTGAGLFVIDHFNPNFGEFLELRAYDGPNGTGNLLGSALSASFNFQNNNLYFMGVSDTDSMIRSIQFIDTNTLTGDTIGLDDIRFARIPVIGAVPEPISVFIWGSLAYLVGLAAWRRPT